ncbi:uncharacterized protein F5147DRAFT_770419 [Suillus discolor]|uniref:Uncharacterized protein n=1 Tax=Suillus discolor TaxID=1912936 RepID=A0A9P7FCZ6_9AGAM|nr:uncharacterized protein F5147DRAFT_770419 [Suillus discolor]KAG2113778.1 hypothetical protein F5147DRAFT_770419 [Suillus discolor]
MGRPQDRRQCETLARKDATRGPMASEARKLIYEKDFAVGSAPVEHILKEQSWVPTSNSFSDHLGPLGFNIFRVLVVDLLHEFEIGVWKSLFIHLLCIIVAQDRSLVHVLDHRYRETAMFGQDTIRKFAANSSEMKQMAARNFEDLLQCSIPVFDGLLPEPHNTIVLKLLFNMLHWHGLAKLRMHSDLTLDIMDQVTTTLGYQFHDFNMHVCCAYDTRELRQEVEARNRQCVKQAVKSSATQKGKQTARAGKQRAMSEEDHPAKPAKSVHHTKLFNFQTYKFHALGDYVATIRQYGTCDSFSTEPGELKHHSPKARYCRTDRKLFIKQLARIERRQARIHRITYRVSVHPHIEVAELATSPHVHHHIGLSQLSPVHIGSVLRTHQGDPAIKNFTPKLKDHLLHRIKKLSLVPASRDEMDIDRIILKDDRMYHHNVARFNYTSYDIRRAQDVINPRTTHCNVLGIYHVNVIYIGAGFVDYTPTQMEFLWVRWYEPMDELSGWENLTLDRVSFLSLVGEHSFDFLDLADVLRGSHIIPSFHNRRKHPDGLGLSACAQDKYDWFVDRDMLMCFHYGLGVGHVYSHHQSSLTESQRGSPSTEEVVDDVESSMDDGTSVEDEDEDPNIQDGELEFGSSRESLGSEFDGMYGSDIELDYEN